MSEEQLIPTISVEQLKERIDSGHGPTLIDVREPFEKEIADLGGILVPIRSLDMRVDEIPKDAEVVLYCRSGQRSGDGVRRLREEFGFTNVVNLSGGIIAWSERIDPSIPQY